MNEYTELIGILSEVKNNVLDDSDMGWTRFNSGAELKRHIDQFIVRLRQGDASVLPDIYTEFLPTSTFQEHAIQNNWEEDYMKLSEQFTKIYSQVR